MAIQKNIRTPAAPASYHRITQVRISWGDRVAAFMVANYFDKSFRDDPKGGCVNSSEVVTVKDKFPFTDEHLAAMRAALGMPDSHELLSLTVTYNGERAFCSAAYAKDAFGQRVNSEEQYPGVLKADMPVNFLDILYPLVAAELLPDGENV